MPELPDITIYIEALESRCKGKRIIELRVHSPFLVRTVSPPIDSFVGDEVTGFSRLGKRIVWQFASGRFLVMHLMIAGRLAWQDGSPKIARPGGKSTLATIVFEHGYSLLTEAGSKRRASIHAVPDLSRLRDHDPGGIEPLESGLEEFAEALRSENRTLKRALTNPRSISGIGNSYSDEILHAAKLSPVRLTLSLTDEEIGRLHRATQAVLTDWTNRLRAELAGRFPGRGQVTAFRPDFAVHGKYGQACPTCGMPVQRIQYAENETNYCARCQNEDRVLADRSLSRLLKEDWPRTIEEMSGS